MGILTLGSLFDGSGVVLPALFCIGWYCVVILVSAGDCRFIRLRGGRSSADSARGTCPSGLPSIACGRDKGRICPFICAASARQKDGGPKGQLRQVFPHVSIAQRIVS